MSEKYIKKHFDKIKAYANVIEEREKDEDYILEMVLRDNAQMLERCLRHGTEYILIDEKYSIDIEL